MFYGWSWKNWSDQYVIAFNTAEEAETWLYTEEYDFRDRELITVEKLEELTGGSGDFARDMEPGIKYMI